MKKDKSARRRIIFLAFSILWMIIIFRYSARNADLSTQDSYNAGLFFGHLFYPGFDNLTETARLAFAEMIDMPVRKAAHASEYALLAMLLYGAFADGKAVSCFAGAYRKAWICAVVYAATDEIHQTFVPGRAGRITDVLIDGAGALLGLMVIYVGGNVSFLIIQKLALNRRKC